MSPRDPKSATTQGLKGRTAKPHGDRLEPGKQDAIPDQLRRWIDLVIVPILVDQCQQEKRALENSTDG
jgi:hypothetical protein